MDRSSAAAGSTLSQVEAAALYDRLAAVYDLWGHLTESRARRRALELAEIASGQHVLEVAAGTGLAFVQVVRANPAGRNVGIDISPGMLARAQRRLARAGLSHYELSRGTALAIAEADDAFDLLINNYMFDLLDPPDQARAIAEFRRVLKPGGRLVLANMTLAERTGAGLYEKLYRLSPSLMGGCRGVRMSAALEQGGFAVQSREYIQQMLFPSEVILATKDK